MPSFGMKKLEYLCPLLSDNGLGTVDKCAEQILQLCTETVILTELYECFLKGFTASTIQNIRNYTKEN